jgi:hypothetical protein
LPYYYSTQIKTENWDYLHIINNLLRKKNISLTIHKVKAHSKNVLNRNADILAKRGINRRSIELNLNHLITLSFFSWHNTPLTSQIRKFTKNLIFIETFNKFLQLKNIRNIPQFNIKTFISITNSCNYKPNLFSLRIKILLNNLPTMSNLHLRYSYLYLTPNCTRCNQFEDTLHLLNCHQVFFDPHQILNQYTIQTITELKIENTNPTTITNILLDSNTHNTPSQNFLFLIQGTIPLCISDQLQTILTKNTTNFCLCLSNYLLSWFNLNIWQTKNRFQHD